MTTSSNHTIDDPSIPLISFYKCGSDPLRLRIINLLLNGPLCVSHIQEVLEQPQVKISKHLAYLKKNRMVATQKRANWVVYQIEPELCDGIREQLTSLERIADRIPVLQSDNERRAGLQQELDAATRPNPLAYIN